MNYYPHHIGDYLRDTAHLSMLEDAAYRRMLDLYYASERPLPLNLDGLYRLLRARSKDERDAVDTILQEYFKKGETGWHNKRADEEIQKGQGRTQAARENGKKGGRPVTQQEPTGLSMGTPDVTQRKAPQNQKPIPKKEDAPTGAPPNGGSSVWDFGKSLLTEQGLSLQAAGGLIGSWLKDWDEPTVADAIRAGAGKAEARAYIAKILSTKPKKGASTAIKIDL